MQLSIIRKDCTPSGQEELRTESFTVALKERAEEPVATKPGVDPLLISAQNLTFFTSQAMCELLGGASGAL